MARPKKGSNPSELGIERKIALPGSSTIPGLGEYANSPSGPAVLKCGCTEYLKKAWCQHLQLIMDHEYDGKDASGVHPLMSHVIVPIFRAPELQVPVLVLEANEQGFRKAGIRIAQDRDDDGSAITADLLGYVIDGQGRKSLRTLVMDWLNERGAHGDYPQCVSAFHTGGEYKFEPPTGALSNNPKGAVGVKKNFADLASLVLYGTCYDCDNSAGIPEI